MGRVRFDREIGQPPKGEEVDHDDRDQDAVDHLLTMLAGPPDVNRPNSAFSLTHKDELVLSIDPHGEAR